MIESNCSQCETKIDINLKDLSFKNRLLLAYCAIVGKGTLKLDNDFNNNALLSRSIQESSGQP